MSNVSRRKFIKNVGLFAILAATGNIHDGLSFFSPSQLNIQDKRQSPLSEANSFTLPENTAKNLFIGVGNPGLRIGKTLQSGTKTIDALAGKPVIIQHFSPDNNQINGFISEAQIVFLVGSMKDRDFWIARELILSHDIFLLYTIVIEDVNHLLSAQCFPVNEKEGCIFIPERHFEHQAILTVHSLLSMSTIPGPICFDVNDLKSTIGSKSGYMIHTVSSYANSLSAFKQNICTCKNQIKNSSSLLLHIMYDENIDCTLKDLTNISDETYNCCNYDTKLVWTCTDSLKLDADFRATLFISMNDNLIDDLILAKEKTDSLNTLHPTTPPLTLKEYLCPHCNGFLFKGNVQKLNMACPHCRKMINV